MEQVTFIVHLPAKPEHIDDLEAGVRGVLDAMSAEPDYLHATLHRSQQSPNTLVVYESWACSREDFLKNHMGKSYRAEYEKVLPSLLAEPRRIEFLDTLWVVGE